MSETEIDRPDAAQVAAVAHFANRLSIDFAGIVEQARIDMINARLDAAGQASAIEAATIYIAGDLLSRIPLAPHRLDIAVKMATRALNVSLAIKPIPGVQQFNLPLTPAQ